MVIRVHAYVLVFVSGVCSSVYSVVLVGSVHCVVLASRTHRLVAVATVPCRFRLGVATATDDFVLMGGVLIVVATEVCSLVLRVATAALAFGVATATCSLVVNVVTVAHRSVLRITTLTCSVVLGHVFVVVIQVVVDRVFGWRDVEVVLCREN